MAPGSTGTQEDPIDDKDAKNLLDSIGKIVHDQVKNGEAQTYKEALKGDLQKANGIGERASSNKTCDLVQEYYGRADNSNRYPCANRQTVRFSDEYGGQCTYNRIKDSENNDNSIGACAPYRRLHLCDYNLEKMGRTSTTKHDLLAEVCMAAKYEGGSIKTHYTPHQHKYGDSDSQICTVLARSFADIGDIIRGKDLYLGDKKKKQNETEREKLEQKLKEIFKKIHSEVTTNGELQKRYGQDGQNFYQLREDWWYANRETVWKAMTCEAPESASYFRKTCDGGENPTATQGNCKCINGDVPTYFDYVPQYLRWFEEWAEDFCRKREYKLENAKNKCRGNYENGEPKYCSRNGYDCKKTVRGKNILVSDTECTKCSVVCTPFVKWIDNQKEEFLKQKEKYHKEIQKKEDKTTTITIGDKTINNLYVSDFYEKLEKQYGSVQTFLGLLNQETTCKDHPGVEEKSHIDFTENTEKTFSHKEYCDTCPWCAKKVKEGGKWTESSQQPCTDEQNEDSDNKRTTDIDLLVKDKDGTSIVEKLGGLCNTSTKKNIQTRKCYYDKNKEENSGGGDKDYCILQDGKEKTQNRTIRPYYVLFLNWIDEMLKDSILWRKELDRCIKNEKESNCIRECKSKCDCFERWVEQKEQEWKQLEKHYEEEDFSEDFGIEWTPYGTLELYLKNIYLEMIQKDYPQEKLVQEMQTINEENSNDIFNCTKENNSITKFLQHEAQEAKKCKENNPPEKCQPKKLKNPCSGESGKKLYPVLAGKMAYQMHVAAKTGLGGNRNALKADASKGEYRKRGKADELNNICKINPQHSNDSRNGNNGEPCEGKDGSNKRFEIGTKWETGGTVQMTETEAYMPPRRQHMCTSNLENLDVDSVIKNDKASHSLLGDVLLSANHEAKKIKELYEKNKDQSGQNDKNGLTDDKTVCRAMKNSFADIGDIIRGRDLWDNKDQVTLQDHLKTIFGKIKGELKGEDKYNRDDKKSPPYKQLRADWWEANRDQIWEAMICETKSHPTIKCDKTTPYDDYIPQRLRWMTEWAEWYCKAQTEAYGELLRDCGSCTGKVQCKEGTKECKDCKSSCEKYTEFVNKWKPQWNTMEIKYVPLYLQAKNAYYGISFPGADYQLMVDFLSKLHTSSVAAIGKNGETTNSPYATPAGYIHQEARVGKCLEQNVFCDNNGNNEKYAFKKTPPLYKYACECKPKAQPTAGGGPARAAKPRNGHTEEDDVGAASEDEEEDEDEEEEEEGEAEAEVPATTDTSVDVCSIVAELFNDTSNFSDACTLKYSGNSSRLGWKCIPSGDEKTTTSSSGAICIPPRRRKLYVTPLTKWENNSGSDTVVSGETLKTSGTSSQSDKTPPASTPATSSTSSTSSQNATQLLTAFVESAAVETFFLWDRYKKIKEKEIEEKRKRENGGLYIIIKKKDILSDQDHPQNKLNRGEIPEEFKRQMFYTLADYKDILFSGSKDDNTKSSTYNDILRGDKEIQERERKVKDAINNYFSNNGNKQPPSSPPNSEKLKSWWNNNAKHIWNAMVCALTYKENGSGGDGKTTITQDESLKEQLLENGKQPKQNGTHDYTYENVVLKDENSDTRPKTTGGEKTTLNTPKLRDFVEIPTFFRYLHEWGEEFCRKRKDKFKKLDKECRGVNNSGDPKYCSGDGHDCEKNSLKHHKMFEDSLCSGCYEQCRKYRKWIDIKFVEYHKQEKKYEEEKQKLNGNSNNEVYQKFYEQIKEKKTAAGFLQSLKHCKNNEGDGSDPNNKISFENPLETFNPSTYCKACPIYGVTCNSGGRRGKSGKDPCTPHNEKGKSWESVFNANGENSTANITVEMVDRRGPFIEKYLRNSKTSQNSLFKDSYLFKSVRNQNWTCKFNGENMDICKLTNFNDKIDLNKYTTFKVFLEYWLEDFIESYYILKKKKLIEQCTKNGGETCNENSKNGCACVKEWVEQKTTEWGDIKKHFKIQNRENAFDIKYKVETFLGDLIPRMDLTNGKEKIQELNKFLRSYECNCAENSPNGKESTPKDIVECLLTKLEDKANKCKTQTSGSKQCTTPPTTLEDDDEPLEEENPVTQPNICPQTSVEEKKKEEEEGDCNPAPTRPKKPVPTRPKEHWSESWRTRTTPRMFLGRRRNNQKTTCDIVREIFKYNNGTKQVGECYRKETYSEWTCDENKIKIGQEGACIPPRRQKLCVHYLKQSMTNTNELKYAFIKCAAAETFLLWQYYKSKNGNANNLDNTLIGGNIPEEFKRQMFYTFGDYRDLCLDTDLSSKTDIHSAVSIAKDNIYKVFKKNYQTSIDHRKSWWETNGPVIWEGMLCALEKASGDKDKLIGDNSIYTYANVKFSGGDNPPTLEKFAQRPQFLRWMTEWGENFCKEQKREYKVLLAKCKDCDVDGDGKCNGKCVACKKQCKEYQYWLEKWINNYKKQKGRYTQVKEIPLYKDDKDLQASDDARVYLDTQLKNMTCTNGSTNENCEYKCMNKASSTNTDMPESLDEKPKKVKDKCNCIRDECSGLSVTGSGFSHVSAFGGGVPEPKCKGFEEHLPKKMEPPQYDPTNDILKTTIPIGISLALGSIAFLFIKKKTKSSVGNLFQILQIPKSDYNIPTLKSKNRYIPYRSGTYKGKTYIYMEGDSSGDEKYAFMSDTTDVTSSESEYEELDISDIYVPGSPKYKTLIEVVLEPSGNNTTASDKNTPSDTQNDIQNDGIPSSKITDNEWNTLKDEFISQYLQSEPLDVPNDYSSRDIPFNTQPSTLYFDNNQEKPFITSIHDRNLYSGEEYNYNVNMVNNDDIPINRDNNVYSGIDLINDALNGDYDIYDEILKRKENELFGTNHTKHTTTNRVATQICDGPITNQLNLFHRWLDRHRNMCEQWNNKEDILNKLNEEWNKDNDRANVPNDNKTLNTDVSIQIHMDNPKPINEFTNMDTILDDLEKYNEPYYDVQDDIYYDVHDHDASTVDTNAMDVPSKVQIEMDVNTKLVKEKYPISDVWDI
uniref:Erythrocyte membrane protein 1 n=3 Tax=Plasmodium falciparum TaxID=5833 RepID=A3R6S1_PLAFA|nr:erythrocyte membrane protein 1 [Plasmodium falciparum]